MSLAAPIRVFSRKPDTKYPFWIVKCPFWAGGPSRRNVKSAVPTAPIWRLNILIRMGRPVHRCPLFKEAYAKCPFWVLQRQVWQRKPLATCPICCADWPGAQNLSFYHRPISCSKRVVSLRPGALFGLRAHLFSTPFSRSTSGGVCGCRAAGGRRQLCVG